MKRIFVWDIAVRSFHWLLVIAFAANALVIDDDSKLHNQVGYIVLATGAFAHFLGLFRPWLCAVCQLSAKRERSKAAAHRDCHAAKPRPCRPFAAWRADDLQPHRLASGALPVGLPDDDRYVLGHGMDRRAARACGDLDRGICRPSYSGCDIRKQAHGRKPHAGHGHRLQRHA